MDKKTLKKKVRKALWKHANKSINRTCNRTDTVLMTASVLKSRCQRKIRDYNTGVITKAQLISFLDGKIKEAENMRKYRADKGTKIGQKLKHKGIDNLVSWIQNAKSKVEAVKEGTEFILEDDNLEIEIFMESLMEEIEDEFALEESFELPEDFEYSDDDFFEE